MRLVRKLMRTQVFTLIILLILVYAYFTYATGGRFLRMINIMNIMNVTVTVSLITIGATYMMIAGAQDLSQAANGMLCAIALASLLRGGTHWVPALILALSIGGLVGLFNAYLINNLNFQPFIATLASSQVCRGIMYIISSSRGTPSYIFVTDPAIGYLGGGRIGGSLIPFSVVLSLVLVLVYGVMLKMSKFGRKVYMVGGNRAAAMLSGINPKKISYVLCVNSGILGALSGIILAGNLRSATVSAMDNLRFSGIISAILGGISFGGGTGGMGGAFVGLMLLNGFQNGLIVVGVGIYWQMVAQGSLLLLALALDYVRHQNAIKKIHVGA